MKKYAAFSSDWVSTQYRVIKNRPCGLPPDTMASGEPSASTDDEQAARSKLSMRHTKISPVQALPAILCRVVVVIIVLKR